MTYSQLTIILHFFVIIANSVFFGTRIIVPLLFLHEFFKINYAKIQSRLFVLTANNVLLIGGACFLFTAISNTFFAWVSGNVYERDMIISSITGPKWYQYITPIFNFALLPNLLWFKKIKTSIYSSFSIVLVWLITTNLVKYFSAEPEYILSAHKKQSNFDFNELALNSVVYGVIFLIMYFYNNRKNKSLPF